MNTKTPSTGRRVRHAIVLSTIGVAALCVASLRAQSSTSSSTPSSTGSTYNSSSSSSTTPSDRSRNGSTTNNGSSMSGGYNSGATDASSTSGSTYRGAAASDGSTTSLARGDRRFVMKASEMNNEEVRLSQLAAQQASDPQVRSYAQMLVDEHNQSGTELSAIASRKGVVDTTRDDYDQRATTKLSKKTGNDFDKAYLEKMADAHEDVIDLFEKEAKSGKDAELQAFASKMLPKLREHEEHAKSLEKSVKK